MDKRAVLVALAQARELTPERAAVVRQGAPSVVKRHLLEWCVAPVVMAAAGLPALSSEAIDDARAQELVDEHLAALGIDAVPTRWVRTDIGVDRDWGLAAEAAGDARDGLAVGLHTFTARVLDSSDPRWAPLRKLASASIEVFGLAWGREYFGLGRR